MKKTVLSTLVLAFALTGCGASAPMAAPASAQTTSSAQETAPTTPAATDTQQQNDSGSAVLRLDFHVARVAGWTLLGQKDLKQGDVESGMQFTSTNTDLAAQVMVYAIRGNGPPEALTGGIQQSFAKKGMETSEVQTGSTGSCFQYAANSTNQGVICARYYPSENVTLTFVGRWPASSAGEAANYYFELAKSLSIQ